MFFGRDKRKEFEKEAMPFSNHLFKFAYFRLGKKEDAEDVCQEAYLRAFRSFHTFRPGTNMRAWLTTILINVINDFRKKQSHIPEPTDEDLDFERLVVSQSESFADPAIKVAENEVDPELLSALQKLPGVFLHPLLLREIEDLSYTDIASVLSVPVGTVMSRLYRARHLLRAALENAPDGSSKKPGGKGTSASKESSKQTSKEQQS